MIVVPIFVIVVGLLLLIRALTLLFDVYKDRNDLLDQEILIVQLGLAVALIFGGIEWIQDL